MKKVLFFLLAIIFAIQGYGQTVQTSFGTTTQSYIPIYTFYGYNYSQQIVTNAELVAGGLGTTYGQIVKIRWHWNGTGLFTNCVDWKIYIGHTTKTSFSSSTDWEPLTSLTLVYDSLLTIPTAAGWVEFILQTPFTYNGTDNLIIAVDENTPSYSSTAYFTSQSATSRGIYYYSDGTNPDPAAPPSGTVVSTVPNIQLYFMETCPGPGNLTSSAVTHENATISWTPNGTETLWNLEYKISTDLTWTPITGLTAPTYTFNSLLPSTTYNVRVQADCGADQSAFVLPISFTTLASAPTTLPYTSDFENPTENLNWGFINGSQTNQWVIGNASYNPAVNNTVGGENALHISNDAGLSWAYTLATSSTPSRVYAYRDFTIDPGVTEIKLNLDWIANGNGYGDFLRVYWVPASTIITPGVVPPGGLDVSAALGTFFNNTNNNIHLQQVSTWQQNEFIINSTQFPTLGGNTWRLLIHWRNESTSAAVQPPATVDNMTLVVSNCPTPIIDSINNIAQNSVDIHFTENGSTNAWNFQYRILGTNTWSLAQATMNPFTLSGLQPSTSYEVRMQSDCSFEQSAWTPIKKFNTACGTITQIPWADYFDNYGTGTTIFPACWTRKANVADRPYISSTNFSSPGSMYFNCASSGIYNNASTPMIDAAYPINTLMLNFRSYFSGSDDTLYVGTMTDPIDSTTFTEIAKFSTTATATWINQVLYLNSYTGTDQYITFRTKYGASSSTIYIDNLQILPMPTCLIPNTLSSTNVTAFEATINWLPGDLTQTTWWIYYKPVASIAWDSVQVFAYLHTLTNLIPSTNYQFYMRTDCGSELSAATNVSTFMTQCVPVSTIPWNDSFESITATNQLPPCWAATSLGSYTYTQTSNYAYNNRVAKTGNCAAYFRWSCNDRFFTPGFQLTAGVAYKFSYWYITDGYSGWTSLQAGVYSAQTAGSLIQTLNTVNGPTNTTYQEAVCYFTPTVDGVYHFGIYCQAQSAPMYLTIDDIALDFAPSCLPVQQLAVSNIVGTSAYVSWFPAGTPDSYTVELSETGSGVWSTFSTTTPNFVLTNLTELTDYSVQVYPMCSGVEGPRDTVDFTTVCAAGGELIVGTPNATTSSSGNYLPTQTWYDYSYSQQIYDATEVSGLDTIYGISFQYFSSFNDTRGVVLYIGHTSQSTFTGPTNFIPLDSLTIAYQGALNLSNAAPGNWVNINFPTPFAYDGINNIVIALRDTTGAYNASSGDKFRTHNANGTKSLYFYQDDNTINPVNPSAITQGITSNRNNIKFLQPCATVTCYAPNVILSDVTNNSAEMIIVPGASETSWEGEYKAASDPTWTTLGTNVTSPFLLPALNSNTTYSVRFRTVCSASDVSTWKSVTFTTDCGTIETLPFVENFDSYTANSSNIPTCWNKVTTNGSYPYIYGYNALSTPNALYFYSSSTTYATIVLPPVDATIPLNTLQLTLWGRNYSAGQNVKIGVMTNPNDAATFTLIGTFTPTAAGTYEEYIVSFANYTDTGVYIAIKSDNIAQSLSNEFYIDNLSLDLIPSCPKPQFLNANTTDVTATMFWTETGSAQEWEVEWDTLNFVQGQGNFATSTDTFLLVNGLTAWTDYQFYVRAVCGVGDTSLWTGPYTFNTQSLSPVTYLESFMSGTVAPAGYMSSTWYLGSPTAVPGNPAYNIYVNLYNSTPKAVTTTNIGPLQPNNILQFEYKLANSSSPYAPPAANSGNFVLAISTDWGVTFTNIDTVFNNAIAGYQTYNIDLSAYASEIVQFKITGNWNSGDYYLAVDNIYVGPAITCPTPSALVTSNPSTTSIDLGWTENGTATEWQIEYGPVGFTQGLGTFLSVTTNPPFTIPLLTPNNSYDFYVRSICSVGDTSMWSSNIQGTTLCLPSTLPFTEDFTSLSFPMCWSQTYSGALTSNRWSVGSDNEAGGTGNEMVCSWQQAIGISRLITPGIDFGTNTSATLSFKHFYSDFDPGVTLKIQSSTDLTTWTDQPYSIIGGTGDVGPETATLTLTIPTGVNYIAFVVDGNHFNINNWYIDDVTITSSTPVCAIPTNLAVNGVTSSTATATWSAGGTETQWEIAYKPTASATWMTAFVSPVATYNLPSLLAATAYDVKVRAICGAGDTSAYTAIVNFTTLATSCPAPTNLAATAITTTGATITWTPGGSETAWELDYKLASASTWTTVNVSAPSHVLNTLVASTNYNVRVRAVCGSSNLSDYTAIVNFTTATPPCDIPTNVLVPTATITDQSAVVTWTAAAGQTQWQVEYKLVSSANWTTMAVSTSTTQPIQALQSNSTYEVRVKAICSATNESPFTTPVQFTTTGAVTYIITATASGPGTINPTGSVVVNAGANQTFTFTPTGNAHVVSLLVDNLSATYSNNEYTFSNVLANHTISVNFAEAIDENGLAKLVELYPNPTNATIEIRLNETQLQVKECRVYDIYGKLMSIVPVNADNTQIDATDFAAGVYFIRMNSEMGVITKKFVKK